MRIFHTQCEWSCYRTCTDTVPVTTIFAVSPLVHVFCFSFHFSLTAYLLFVFFLQTDSPVALHISVRPYYLDSPPPTPRKHISTFFSGESNFGGALLLISSHHFPTAQVLTKIKFEETKSLKRAKKVKVETHKDGQRVRSVKRQKYHHVM
jgi:hypothetical protein